jgi:hypothetical protein
MNLHMNLAPRYRLDDDAAWLEGIDPSRHYWIAVNGDRDKVVSLPGVVAESVEALREIVKQFRDMQTGQQMAIARAVGECMIYCVGQNCYALAGHINGAEVWHLFDRETLESLLRTAHPDWQCAPQHVELGRKLLFMAWKQPVAA